MSELTDFVTGVYTECKTIIGATSFVIGSGGSVDVIQAEEIHDRASEMNGFEQSSSLRLVCSLADFTAEYASTPKSYLGKICTHDGDEWRIGGIEPGVSFVTITLVSRNEVG